MLLSVNCFLHMLHWNGLSPECTRKCLFQCSRSTNLLPHVSQGNGFSPVWVITCFPNLHFEENCFPHRRQKYLPAFSCLSTLHKKNCSRAITPKSSIYQTCQCAYQHRHTRYSSFYLRTPDTLAFFFYFQECQFDMKISKGKIFTTHDMKEQKGTGGIESPILNLSTRYQLSASHPRCCSPSKKSTWHPMHRRLSEPQNKFCHFLGTGRSLATIGIPTHSLTWRSAKFRYLCCDTEAHTSRRISF